MMEFNETIKAANKAVLEGILESPESADVTALETKFNKSVDEAQEGIDEKILEIEKAHATAVEELTAKVDALEVAKKELTSEVLQAQEKTDEDTKTIEALNAELESKNTEVEEIKAEVTSAIAANEELSKATEETPVEVNANPNAKVVQGVPLTSREIWEKAKNSQN